MSGFGVIDEFYELICAAPAVRMEDGVKDAALLHDDVESFLPVFEHLWAVIALNVK